MNRGYSSSKVSSQLYEPRVGVVGVVRAGQQQVQMRIVSRGQQHLAYLGPGNVNEVEEHRFESAHRKAAWAKKPLIV